MRGERRGGLIGGYRRVKGAFGPIHLEKVLHPEDGEPMGWLRVFARLSPDHETDVRRPSGSVLRSRNASKVYGKNSARAVDAFLKEGAQMLSQESDERVGYSQDCSQAYSQLYSRVYSQVCSQPDLRTDWIHQYVS